MLASVGLGCQECTEAGLAAADNVGELRRFFRAAISSVGIGMVDQGLQPILGPVMGKITVLFMIILFLQVKPGGLFPARSRSLDD